MSSVFRLASRIPIQQATRTSIQQATHTSLRTFTAAATMAQKHEWIVILPDNAGALEKRMSVRQSHLSNLKPDIDSGFWVLGGATLDEPIKEGSAPKINGSVMMALAETKEEVLEKLRKDTYWENGVWDESKIQIYPFKSAVRSAL